MSNRLDKDRQLELEPKRMRFAVRELEKLGYDVDYNDTCIRFQYNGNIISLFPYSGWHTGKGIVDGRGIKKLLAQLK